jgi:hypothetical protein
MLELFAPFSASNAGSRARFLSAIALFLAVPFSASAAQSELSLAELTTVSVGGGPVQIVVQATERKGLKRWRVGLVDQRLGATDPTDSDVVWEALTNRVEIIPVGKVSPNQARPFWGGNANKKFWTIPAFAPNPANPNAWQGPACALVMTDRKALLVFSTGIIGQLTLQEKASGQFDGHARIVRLPLASKGEERMVFLFTSTSPGENGDVVWGAQITKDGQILGDGGTGFLTAKRRFTAWDVFYEMQSEFLSRASGPNSAREHLGAAIRLWLFDPAKRGSTFESKGSLPMTMEGVAEISLGKPLRPKIEQGPAALSPIVETLAPWGVPPDMEALAPLRFSGARADLFVAHYYDGTVAIVRYQGRDEQTGREKYGALAWLERPMEVYERNRLAELRVDGEIILLIRPGRIDSYNAREILANAGVILAKAGAAAVPKSCGSFFFRNRPDWWLAGW